ncbi:ALP1-like protein isoform X1 [Tanacetum coccineum]
MSDSTGGMTDLDDMEDIEMIMQKIQYEQSLQEQEAESSHRSNFIYRERDLAEERLMADYFGAHPKYPSIDCMHWEWRNCPKEWHGQFARDDKKYSTIMLEAVASYDLWIWYAFSGVAGANNDITVLNNSSLFDDLLDDIAPVAPFEVNGVTFEQVYYLADGIYPQWSSFDKSFSVANSKKNAVFKRKQESARKDIERAFGVL